MKTKEMLATTLKKLMKNSNLDKITVTELTDCCGINRQTFYYHFKDIYELVYWVLDNEESKIFHDNILVHSTVDIVTNLYNYLITNEETISAIYYSLSKDILERYLVEKIQYWLIYLMKNEEKLVNVSEDVIITVCNFYKYAFLGIVFEWIRNGMSRDIGFSLNVIGKVVGSSLSDTALTFDRLNKNPLDC